MPFNEQIEIENRITEIQRLLPANEVIRKNLEFVKTAIRNDSSISSLGEAAIILNAPTVFKGLIPEADSASKISAYAVVALKQLNDAACC